MVGERSVKSYDETQWRALSYYQGEKLIYLILLSGIKPTIVALTCRCLRKSLFSWVVNSVVIQHSESPRMWASTSESRLFITHAGFPASCLKTNEIHRLVRDQESFILDMRAPTTNENDQGLRSLRHASFSWTPKTFFNDPWKIALKSSDYTY